MTTRNKYLLAIIPMIILGAVLYFFRDIVSYVVVAWVLSMIGAPLVAFLRKYMSKSAAAGITLAAFVVCSFLLLWIFIPPLVTQARNLASVDYQKVVNSLEEPLNDWEDWLAKRGLIASHHPASDETAVAEKEKVEDLIKVIPIDSILAERHIGHDSLVPSINLLVQINKEDVDDLEASQGPEKSFFDTIRDNLFSVFNPALVPKLLGSVLGSISNVLIAFMSVLFIAFFFLREQGLFNNMVSTVVPDKYESKTVNAIDESSKMLIRYFIGVITQITVITIFVSIVLKILGVKNALLIGFFAGLMNVIPYIGPIIGASFGVMITVSSNLELPFYTDMLPLIIKVLVVFAIMQLLDNFILQPNIFSRSVKAHPLEIFLVVLIGAKLGGVGGMVLAIPGYTVLRVLAKVFLSEFKIVQRITQGI